MENQTNLLEQRLFKLAELKRLGRFMARLGGQPPSMEKLVRVMQEYDAARCRIRAAQGFLAPRAYSEALARLHRDGSADVPANSSAMGPRGVPVGLVGGPLLTDQFQIFDLIEQAGGYVALDGTETGERTLPAPFDRRRLQDDPFMELAEAYFGSIPDAFRRPNSLLYRWLKKEIAERGIRGILLRRYLWCDTWHAEVQRMREWAPVPVFDLDVGDDDSWDRATSRIQSFVAMLK